MNHTTEVHIARWIKLQLCMIKSNSNSKRRLRNGRELQWCVNLNEMQNNCWCFATSPIQAIYDVEIPTKLILNYVVPLQFMMSSLDTSPEKTRMSWQFVPQVALLTWLQIKIVTTSSITIVHQSQILEDIVFRYFQRADEDSRDFLTALAVCNKHVYESVSCFTWTSPVLQSCPGPGRFLTG